MLQAYGVYGAIIVLSLSILLAYGYETVSTTFNRYAFSPILKLSLFLLYPLLSAHYSFGTEVLLGRIKGKEDLKETAVVW